MESIRNLEIKQEQVQHQSEVFEVNKMAFNQIEEALLVDRLRHSKAFVPELSLIASADSKIIGHILCTRISIINDGVKTESLALAPLAVRPDYQRRSIGSQLVKKALNIARELEFGSIIVLGHPSFYKRFGFLPAGKWNIRAPFDVPSEVFMALALYPGALDRVHGTVNYDSAFDQL